VIYALQIWEPSILWGFFFCGGGTGTDLILEFPDFTLNLEPEVNF
jgi:hypothetical protein